jgi:hypothetical protein
VFPVGALAVVAGFGAVLSAGFGWTVAALLLAVAAIVVGLVRVFGAARLQPGTGHALAGALVGAAALVLVLLLWGLGLTPSPAAQVSGLGEGSGGGGTSTDDGPTFEPTARPIAFVAAPDFVYASSTASDSTDDAGNPVTFGAGQLTDGDASTAWRVTGDGVGEEVTFTWNAQQHFRQVALITGYAKQDPVTGTDRFTENRRPDQVTVIFDGSAQWVMPLNPDDRTFQTLDVDLSASTVTIRIDSSTAADADYAAMSEVQFTAEG